MLKDAAKRIAFAEDRAIFEGYGAAGIQGIRQGTSNPIKVLPADTVHYPDVIADYQRTFRVLKTLPCDVFLASHGGFYGLREKYPKLASGVPWPSSTAYSTL